MQKLTLIAILCSLRMILSMWRLVLTIFICFIFLLFSLRILKCNFLTYLSGVVYFFYSSNLPSFIVLCIVYTVSSVLNIVGIICVVFYFFTFNFRVHLNDDVEMHPNKNIPVSII